MLRGVEGGGFGGVCEEERVVSEVFENGEDGTRWIWEGEMDETKMTMEVVLVVMAM